MQAINKPTDVNKDVIHNGEKSEVVTNSGEPAAINFDELPDTDEIQIKINKSSPLRATFVSSQSALTSASLLS